MRSVETTKELVSGVYRTMEEKLETVRRRLGRPLTLVEKIVLGHLDDPASQELDPGKSYLRLRPDRVAMQDATAQMALLQFMLAGRGTCAVPTTVHCDHLIRAQAGAGPDLETALGENREVYEFLRTASARYGIGFWKPGSGIIHQVVLENYAFPGGLLIGTDSHTPNAGGLGMVASGVGGADAVDVISGMPWEVLQPNVIGVRLTGRLQGWTAPKDIILHLCGLLTTKGGTNRILEYFGPGVASISCTGKGTITNMGAELGATGSTFPFDERMAVYLRATRRAELADLAEANRSLVTADPEVEENPEDFYERVIEIDLDRLEPHVVGPHRPDLARPVSELKQAVEKEGFPDRISYALIGSCTNSSYEDLCRSADVAEQARAHGAAMATKLLVTPGSEDIRATIERDGQLASLESVGASVLANACGPCIGQWRREDLQENERNTIVTSFNRNFPRRNDGNAETLAFIGSPEIVTAFGLAGRLSFNPLTDELEGGDGEGWKVEPPEPAPEIPADGFVANREGYVPPAREPSSVTVHVDPGSERLELLTPFEPWDERDFVELPVLGKSTGQTTTDHISPAGPWLRYRGHLDRISDNLFTGVKNAFSEKPGRGVDQTTGERDLELSRIARAYKERGLRWVMVGDENYGEGSSREHAAMEPRHLGCAAVVARSFARIHETNLKKQGILPLTFADPADYDRIGERDRLSLVDLETLAPGSKVRARIHHADGSSEEIGLRHTMSEEQIGWFRAGSALNKLREEAGG
jgi:aconitate hydratase